MNKTWKDLSVSIGVDDVLIRSVGEYDKGIAGQARNDVQQQTFEETQAGIKVVSPLNAKQGVWLNEKENPQQIERTL